MGRFGLSPPLKHVRKRHMASRNSYVGRSLTPFVSQAAIRARINKQLDYDLLTFPGGDHQRGVALLVSNVHIHPASDEFAHYFGKPAPRSEH
jgi:hypothetical protein